MEEHRFESIKVTTDGPVAVLTLDRPQYRNALDVAMLLEIERAAQLLNRQDEVRVVKVTAQGPTFAAGADIKELRHEIEAGPEPLLCDAGRRAADAIATMRPLTVASMHGYCVGGGMVLAAACDFRVASTDTVFWVPELELGIPLAWGGVPRLIRELGPSLTKELIFTCRQVRATELPLGFLYEICEPEALTGATDALVDVLCRRPRFSTELSKRHINRLSDQISSTRESESEAHAFMVALQQPEVRTALDEYSRRFS